MTPAILRTALPLLAAISLTACNVSETNMNNSPSNETEQQDRGRARLNPNPKRAYEIVMTIDGAPGPFGSIEASAQYDVVNENECGHINSFAGVAEKISNFELVPLTKVSDTEYRGTVYADRMLDEDYYGRGICRWQLIQAGAVLRATGSSEETRFLPFIPEAKIAAGSSQTLYFWKGGYPRDRMDNYPDYGERTVEGFKPELRGDLFKVTLTSREVLP